jgi:hypothetical protein
METVLIIKAIAILLPYVIKILEQVSDLDEVKEMARILKSAIDSDDFPKLLDLLKKIK